MTSNEVREKPGKTMDTSRVLRLDVRGWQKNREESLIFFRTSKYQALQVFAVKVTERTAICRKSEIGVVQATDKYEKLAGFGLWKNVSVSDIHS